MTHRSQAFAWVHLPGVQSGDVPVVDGFLPGLLGADGVQGDGELNQTTLSHSDLLSSTFVLDRADEG